MAACSSRGMEVLSSEVQLIDSFLDHTLLTCLVSRGRPAFDALKLTPHQPPTQGNETQKYGHAYTLDDLSCSCVRMHQAGCMMVQYRNSGHSPDAHRGCTAASTGKGAAWEQKLQSKSLCIDSENTQLVLPLEF